MAPDSADAGGGYTARTLALLQSVNPVLTGNLGAWMQSKTGRRVQLKVGDVEVYAMTVSETKKPFERAQALQTKQKNPEAKIGNRSLGLWLEPHHPLHQRLSLVGQIMQLINAIGIVLGV